MDSGHTESAREKVAKTVPPASYIQYGQFIVEDFGYPQYVFFRARINAGNYSYSGKIVVG